MRVAVVIPCLNEEASIGELVRAMPHPPVGDVIVVDNGSTDRTAAAAREAGARVVTQLERGYGNACLAGVRAASDADLFIFMDGDGSDDPREIPRLAAPILAGEADIVLGVRHAAEPGALTPQQVVGNRVALTLIALRFGRRLRDMPSFKAVRRETLEGLQLQERTYGWTAELLVKALRHGVRITEVPATHYRRAGGRSKVSGTIRGTVGAGLSIMKVVARYAL